MLLDQLGGFIWRVAWLSLFLLALLEGLRRAAVAVLEALLLQVLLVGVHGALVLGFLLQAQHQLGVPFLFGLVLGDRERTDLLVDVAHPLLCLIRGVGLQLQLHIRKLREEDVPFFRMQGALLDILKVVDIQRLGLVSIILVFNELPILDFEEAFDLNALHFFGDAFAEEVALLVARAVALAGVDRLLVLVEFVEGESEGALAGAGVVPVLEEGFSAAGDE